MQATGSKRRNESVMDQEGMRLKKQQHKTVSENKF